MSRKRQSPIRVILYSVMIMTSETRPPETMGINNEGDRRAVDTDEKGGGQGRIPLHE